MARSLMDGLGLETVGRGHKRGTVIGPRRERAKAALAGSMLLVASGILSWHFGLFPAAPGPVGVPPTTEQVDELKDRMAQTDQLVRDGVVVIGSN